MQTQPRAVMYVASLVAHQCTSLLCDIISNVVASRKAENLPLIFRETHQDKPIPNSLSFSLIFLERNALTTLTLIDIHLNCKKIKLQHLAEKLTKEKYNPRKV